MSTKTISGTYSAGYSLRSIYNALSITSAGSIGGTGLVTNAYANIENAGHVLAANGANGVTLDGLSGGDLINDASGYIAGGAAAVAKGAGVGGNNGGDGVYSGGVKPAYEGLLTNLGHMVGGAGGTGRAGLISGAGAGGSGGEGAQILELDGAVDDYRVISGGAGGAGGAAHSGYGGAGGAGGAAAGLTSAQARVNVFTEGAYAALYGGAGGAGGYGPGRGAVGGMGGAGVNLSAGGFADVHGFGNTTTYYARVQGGAGGTGGASGSSGLGGYGGAGGAGLSFGGHGSLTGDGLIVGGAGGNGGTGSISGAGGNGGDGVDFLAGGALQFYAVVRGGAGGNGALSLTGAGAAGRGGYGGIGINVRGAAATIDIVSNGVVRTGVYGGAGGNGSFGTSSGGDGWTGGAGIILGDGGYLGIFSGRVQGGAGGAGGASGSQGGYGGNGSLGVYLGPKGAAVNEGVIVGGGGGVGGASSGSMDRGGAGGNGGPGVQLNYGKLTNNGMIYGGAGGAGATGGVGLGSGGRGGDGILANYSTIDNYGTILGGAGGYGSGDLVSGIGVILSGAGSITNGSSTDTQAFIGTSPSSGSHNGIGVFLEGYGPATVTNFGTISAQVAVEMSSYDTLVVESGCAFIGQVLGGEGHLVLANGTGTVAAFQNAGQDVTVSGSMATTTFTDFASLEIGAAASFGLAAGADTPTSKTLIVDGALTIASTLSVEGTLNVAGALAGAKKSALTIDGGVANFTMGASLGVPTVDVSGTAQVTVATDLTFSGKWKQKSGTLSVGDSDTLTFTGKGSSFSGLLTATGVGEADVVFETKAASVDTLNGVMISDLRVHLDETTFTVGKLGATIGLSAELEFNGLGAGITGAAAGDVLTSDGGLFGSGAIGKGKMGLVNNGVIESNDIGSTPGSLVIDTGAGEDVNNNIIISNSTNGITVSSALVNNSGLLAERGTFTLDGAVSGTGTAQIDGGTLDAASTFNQNVTFTGVGTLELAQSQAYHSTVTGFAHNTGTYLDLVDIGFVSTGEATFSGSSTSGTLTVTDGTHTARIVLSGDYLTTTFASLSDGHGGTLVHLMPPPAAQPLTSAPASPHALVAAMATMGAGSAPALAPTAPEAWRRGAANLMAPHIAIA